MSLRLSNSIPSGNNGLISCTLCLLPVAKTHFILPESFAVQTSMTFWPAGRGTAVPDWVPVKMRLPSGQENPGRKAEKRG